jgi:uncharacterized protein (TIGR04141 family)
LERTLDGRLGGPADVPSDARPAHAEATTYLTRIDKTGELRTDDFDLGYVLTRVRLVPSGRRVTALCEGTVTLARDPQARTVDTLAVTSALNRLEAATSLGPRRFFLLDGGWYKAGAVRVRRPARRCSGPSATGRGAWRA